MAAPPLPGTLVAITDLLDRPESVDVDRVACIVRHDPLVVARLLKIANSAYYGLQRTVVSAERAVDLLGPVTVTGIVMGMSMLRLPSPVEGPAAWAFMRLVRHSMATALFAAEIMSEMEPGATDRADTAFTAGLLHDLGRILLVYHEPERALALYDRHDILRTDDEATVLEMEQLGFGYDHTEAGEYVGRKMDFPDVLVDAIRYHHAPELTLRAETSLPIVAATTCADLSASALGFPFPGVGAWDDVVEHPAWGMLGVPDRGDLQRRIAQKAEAVASDVDSLISWWAPRSAGKEPAPDRPAESGRFGPRSGHAVSRL